ncbi:sodium:solute symporter family protein [Streptomyces sp. 110]|uniref:Sodium:solute symporter family protein n=1 Tax=Streptomyces endocoffeicus TaxID=2898945 RepID=A0ABS1Q7M9_9ACTN|nr:sodium:solute symporter family protein [Streptomyces endocoffeicus]MBL1120678.1 sodium:solute symporter family protein [Streptomyces endocoffeicus]
MTGTLSLGAVDWFLLVVYFGAIIAIGITTKRAVRTTGDFFLAGRSMPAWITGIAFISANLGALEIIGGAANGAQYGAAAVHFYWLGAIPAMVFLGVVMMPFYYSTRVHSVSEYLRRRFNNQTHLLNSVVFAVAQMLLAGVNLFALALIVKLLIGWPLWLSILLSAVFVLAYITLGGLAGAIYGEVLQFFVILAGLIPIVVIGLHYVGGFSGLREAVQDPGLLHTWQGTTPGHWTNPLGDWIGLAMGEGFVLAFGYWTTNFAEVQRSLAAKDLNAARRTPLIAAFPKLALPLFTVVPGMIALVIIPKLGKPGGPTYNDVIPEMMQRFLPNGVLGVALTGLLAAFMAGMAANISGFNTVFTYDIWKPYVIKGRDDRYYLKAGRCATVAGIAVSVAAAFLAAEYDNIQNYIQLLFSFFNSPLFATFLLAMFWKRVTPWAGFWGMLSGTVAAAAAHLSAYHIGWFYPGGEVGPHDTINAQMANFYGALFAFVVDAVVTVAVTLVTKPKPVAELAGLVWGLPDPDSPDAHEALVRQPWWKSPVVLGSVILTLTAALSVWLVVAV